MFLAQAAEHAYKDAMQAPQKTNPLRYALGMFGTSIPINMFKTFAASFYVMKRSAITAEQFALILFLYTFVDAIDNPVYGFLSDRTRTPWGRRRPWLIIGAPLLALCFIGFFNPPAFAQGNAFMYVLLMYILTGTLDSLINANYGALFPELFKGDALRAKTNAMRQAFQLAAMVISIALTPVVTDALGFGTTAIVYGLLAVAVIVFCSLGYHEIPMAETPEKPRLWRTLKDIASNPKVWIFGLSNAFYSAAMSLVMAAVPFFVQYSLRQGGMSGTILMGTVLLLAMGGVIVWAQLIKRRTLMPIWRLALIVLTLAFIPLYFVQGLVPSIIASALVGFGFAGAISTFDLVGAHIMDEDTRRHNVRREGIYSSTMGVLNRFSGLFTALAFLLVGRFYGFESGEVPGFNPDGAARFLLAAFPLVMMFFSVAFSRFLHFDLESEQQAASVPGSKP